MYKVGDNIMCKKGHFSSLTKGGEYFIVETERDAVTIINDEKLLLRLRFMRKKDYYSIAEHFYSIEEHRRIKIKRLLDSAGS